jgi:hypothetical protein
MLVTVLDQIVPLAYRLTIMDAIIAEWGAGTELHLYQTPTTVPPPAVVLGDLVEADFTGYAAHDPVVWSAAFLAPNGDAVTLSSSHVFAATGSTIQNTIYGAYLTSAAAAALLAVFPFDQPAAMTQAGDAIPLVVQFHYSGE